MSQIMISVVCGLVFIVTRITKAIAIKKINAQEKTIEGVVVGVENYSIARKSNNNNVKKAIAKEIKNSKVIDKVIAKVEGKENRSILRSIRNLVFKIVNIIL